MKSFRSFRLDTVNQCLWRGDERVFLAPKAFAVLRYLVEHPGRLVTQNELLEALWPETYVQPEVLRKYILEIRKVLGDRPEHPYLSRPCPNADSSSSPQSVRRIVPPRQVSAHRRARWWAGNRLWPNWRAV